MTIRSPIPAPQTALRRSILLGMTGLLLFTGCLPYSCRREPNEALFPSDSLSRRVAQQTPADTLQPGMTLTGTDAHPLAYPRTVRFLPDGGLAASDAKRNSLFLFGPDGTFRREVTGSAFDVPYLIGIRPGERSSDGSRADTLVVFNAGSDRVDFVTREGRHPARAATIERPAPETLVYMLATDTHLYAKIVGQNTGATLARLDDRGRAEAQIDLDGAYWRHAGFLRAWGDSVLSLSGFRPVVHRLPPDFSAATQPDSLSLVGFDSPMLERSYAYAQDDVDKPPLLSASAAAVGDTLFVLNLRPGWIQIDAYDRSGRLLRRLVEPHDAGDRDFYPVDLDVRRTETGYRFAVAVRSPEPRVELFRWVPDS
jgi:hypothetical protein